jgi:hypothetical protein
MVTCGHCGKTVDNDAYAIHCWNYHNIDIRSLAKKPKGKITKIALWKRKVTKDKQPNNKTLFVKGMIAGALVTAGILLIYIFVF